MFEAAEVGHRIEKAEFKKEEPRIRAELLEIQRKLSGSPHSVIVIISGVEGAGKEETVNLLMEWMDSRGIEVHAPWDVTDEERERPHMWRFWRMLPPKGKIGVLFGSWYTLPIIERTYGRMAEAPFELEMQRIIEFEQMLTREGVVLVKFWMHLGKEVQRRRLHKLRKNPDTAWRVNKLTWKFFKKYDDFVNATEEALRRSSTGHAPWTIIEAEDDRYRSLTVTRTILKAIGDALASDKQKPPKPGKPPLPVPEAFNIIRNLDLSQKLSDVRYKKEILALHAEVAVLTRQLRPAGRSMLLLFEGPDAAGKGGTIRRLTEAMDARNYQVVSVAAPTDEEQARPYLWRFWRHLPRLGRVIIFDRSWYGRVLVERIEGFAQPEEWQRAFAEINAFEKDLTDFGMIVLKFWLSISAEEQLRRFKDREVTPFKQYKLTEEDWRNRAKWNAYEAAACDMVQRTSTTPAPWVLVESVDKNWARVKVLKSVCKALHTALG